MPLAERRHKNAASLVKVVRTPQGIFLSEWAFEDIANEPWGLPAKRPMVYMSDPHEALEKSMWCYEHGMIPLIGERDPSVAAFAAKTYLIDSLITDVPSLVALASCVSFVPKKLDSLSVVIAYPEEALAAMPASEYAAVTRFLLALPETGAYAYSDPARYPVFDLLPACSIERSENGLLLTKKRALVTPIVGYRLLIADIAALRYGTTSL